MTAKNDRAAIAQAGQRSLMRFLGNMFPVADPGKMFLPNWHIDALAWRLQQCLDGHTKRLIITLPPRGLKSYCVSVALVAFALGQDPTKQIICASYSSDLAKKFSRLCRNVMRSDMYRYTFPDTKISPSKDTEGEFETTRGGFRLAASVGGTLTGRGGDIIIVDDPLNASDAESAPKRQEVNRWFDASLQSRLNNKQDGVIIVVMQRLHVDDLVGHLLSQPDHPWQILDLPALAVADEKIPISKN